MKKILTAILTLLMLFSLAACAENDGAPDGMKLAYGSDAAGYYFYVPEEWMVSNVGDVKAAYISTINTTSVSFTEVKLEGDKNSSDYFFNSYFNDSLSEFDGVKDFVLKESGKSYAFGTGDYAAERAKQYIYSYKYPSISYPESIDKPVKTYHEFTFMQILLESDGKFYLFTYSALSEAKEGEESNYERYQEKLVTVIENFKFVKPAGEENNDITYERDEDGYILVTDAGKAGFELFVPEDFKVNYSDAIVSVTHGDGSNINMTRATATGTAAENYWKMRLEELSAFASDIVTITENKPTRLGNNSSTLYGDWAFEYEYSYTYRSERYHVKQILAIDGSNGYVFTYTAKEENYEKHLESINTVIEKVNF